MPIIAPIKKQQTPKAPPVVKLNQKLGPDAASRPGVGVPAVPPLPGPKPPAGPPKPGLPVLTPTTAPTAPPVTTAAKQSGQGKVLAQPEAAPSPVPEEPKDDSLEAWVAYKTALFEYAQRAGGVFGALGGAALGLTKRQAERLQGVAQLHIDLLAAGQSASREQLQGTRSRIDAAVAAGTITGAEAKRLYDLAASLEPGIIQAGGGSEAAKSIIDESATKIGLPGLDDMITTVLGLGRASTLGANYEGLTVAEAAKILAAYEASLAATTRTTAEKKADYQTIKSQLDAIVAAQGTPDAGAGAAAFEAGSQAFISQLQGLGALPDLPADLTNTAELQAWMSRFDDIFNIPNPETALGLVQDEASGRWLQNGQLIDLSPELRSAIARYDMWVGQQKTYDSFRQALIGMAERAKTASEQLQSAERDAAEIANLQSQIRLNDAQITAQESNQRLAAMQFLFQLLQAPHLMGAAKQYGLLAMIQDLLGPLKGADGKPINLSGIFGAETRKSRGQVISILPTAQQWAQMDDSVKMGELQRIAILTGWSMDELIQLVMASRPGGAEVPGRVIGKPR